MKLIIFHFVRNFILEKIIVQTGLYLCSQYRASSTYTPLLYTAALPHRKSKQTYDIYNSIKLTRFNYS